MATRSLYRICVCPSVNDILYFHCVPILAASSGPGQTSSKIATTCHIAKVTSPPPTSSPHFQGSEPEEKPVANQEIVENRRLMTTEQPDEEKNMIELVDEMKLKEVVRYDYTTLE